MNLGKARHCRRTFWPGGRRVSVGRPVVPLVSGRDRVFNVEASSFKLQVLTARSDNPIQTLLPVLTPNKALHPSSSKLPNFAEVSTSTRSGTPKPLTTGPGKARVVNSLSNSVDVSGPSRIPFTKKKITYHYPFDHGKKDHRKQSEAFKSPDRESCRTRSDSPQEALVRSWVNETGGRLNRGSYRCHERR